ncbi:16643_t:CDS:2 [Funneliformis geosporum]|nr:16643_t:CDS:2 [Funneliformis geosporum]
MEHKLEKSFVRDIRQLYQEADDYNVMIEVGQEQNIEIFKAHSVILRARSAYFHTALSTNWAKSDNGIIKMKKPNIVPDVFRIVLRFIYTGIISLSENMLPYYLDILIAADELALTELIDYIIDYILKKEMFWFRQNLRLRYTDEESTIIRLKHFSLISSWIDKKPQPYQHEFMPYMFKLLYRSDHDELKDINKFYKKCNRHGPTVVIIKPSGLNQIIGGYNADIWNKSQKYDTLANSFIFSLDMNHDDENESKGIHSRIKPTVNKVGCTSEKFPWFGNDLNWIKGVCRQQIFEKKIVEYEHFISEKVEVYKLIHKANDNVLYETFYDDSIADDYDFTAEIISEDERPRSQ